MQNVLVPVNRQVGPPRPLAVFLPGLSGNTGQWRLVLDRLADTDADLVLGPSLLHQTPADGGPARVPDVATLLARRLSAEADRPVVLVPHSVGTFVALGAARTDGRWRSGAAAVSSVVAVNGGLAGIARFLDDPVREFVRDPRGCIAYIRLFTLVGLPLPRSLRRYTTDHPRALRLVIRGIVSDAVLRTPDQRHNLAGEAGHPAMLPALRLNRHHWRAFTAAAPAITPPVHFVTGGLDPIASPRDTRAMAAFLPHATVTVLPGVGHAAPLETPDLVAAAVETAIEDARSSPRSARVDARRADSIRADSTRPGSTRPDSTRAAGPRDVAG